NAVELRAVDVRTGKSKVVAGDATADVSGLMLHPRTYEVQAVGITRARLEWKALDPAIDADLATLAALDRGDFEVISRDDADKTWLVSYVQDKGPVKYYAYDRAAKQGTFLFSHRPE